MTDPNLEDFYAPTEWFSRDSVCEQWGDDTGCWYRNFWHDGEKWVVDEWFEYFGNYADDTDLPWEAFYPDGYVPF